MDNREEDWKSKISITRIKNGSARGNKNPNWKGGKTKPLIAVKNLTVYKRWRQAVFIRDSFRCVFCKSKEEINTDHIKPLSIIFRDNGIDSIEKALECTDLWDITNGRTLCAKCHRKTRTYAWRVFNYYLRPNRGWLGDANTLF